MYQKYLHVVKFAQNKSTFFAYYPRVVYLLFSKCSPSLINLISKADRLIVGV